jgi:hypothetical protein
VVPPLPRMASKSLTDCIGVVPGVGVFRAVHEQERRLQFVGGEKWGDFHIDIRCFPNGAAYDCC